MAETQEYEMNNGEFGQGGEDYTQDDQMNGGGTATENGGGDVQGDSGSAEAPGKDDERKLFVGGLSWETSDKELRDHFGSYGEIESINVKTDPNTGRSRGFAFIVFKSSDAIDKVLSSGDHVINNKKIDPKKAKARHGKIFVGGLSTELSDDDIKNYFAQYGTIVEVEMPYDKSKNQRKGFCFITFESEQIVTELLKTPKQSIKGKEVDVKKATPKPDSMAGMRGGRGSRGGRGRGRGDGYGGYGNSYDAGYAAGGRGGGRGKGSGYGGGKQRGGGRGQRHAPY
ncbi:RNA-binding protein squid isoform X7 [Lycorma delicatula]|uniref:RNA-binding protein squid isoform X7 n=1 Tax=Lycorma delicatula TaxID=130591 RepID=UPI003F5182C0